MKQTGRHTAALNNFFALEARKENIKELQLSKEIAEGDEELAEAKDNLRAYLKTPKPCLEIVDTSGILLNY